MHRGRVHSKIVFDSIMRQCERRASRYRVVEIGEDPRIAVVEIRCILSHCKTSSGVRELPHNIESLVGVLKVLDPECGKIRIFCCSIKPTEVVVGPSSWARFIDRCLSLKQDARGAGVIYAFDLYQTGQLFGIQRRKIGLQMCSSSLHEDIHRRMPKVFPSVHRLKNQKYP